MTKTIRVFAAINSPTYSATFEINDNATEDEIRDVARVHAVNMLKWSFAVEVDDD